MKRGEIRAATADERRVLCDDLRSLDAAAWEHPSLCDGWAVRDVVGHLIRIDDSYRYGFPFIIGLVRHGFRLNRFIALDAKRRSAGRSPDELIAALGATAHERRIGARLYPWPAIPLAEFVIHGADIRRPLGLARSPRPEHLVAVAELLVGFRSYPWGSPRRRAGIRLEASDHGWSSGEGRVARAPLAEIVMALAGRSDAKRILDASL